MTNRMPAISITNVKMKCRKDCQDRAFDCHVKCEKYAKYRTECDEQIQQRALKRDVDSYITDAMKRIPGKREI